MWFHVTGTVPAEWDDPAAEPELLVDLGFTGASPGFSAEGLVYASSGAVLCGIAPLRARAPHAVLWINAAAEQGGDPQVDG